MTKLKDAASYIKEYQKKEKELKYLENQEETDAIKRKKEELKKSIAYYQSLIDNKLS